MGLGEYFNLYSKLMENLLALFELDAVCEIVSAYGLRNCGNLFAVDADTALLNQATRFALALCKLAQNEKVDNTDAAVGKKC